jgi:nucleotide-binding universal stress UspA family protein
MFKRIIVPVDGSETSDAAVRLALHLAADHDGEVVFMHAIELNKIVALAGPSSLDPSPAIDAACEAGSAILARAKEAADKAGVRCTCEMPEDQCVACVLDLATKKKADAIVIGSHGRRGISRAVLGSVAEGVLRRATVPVLVCHADWTAEAPVHAAAPSARAVV